MLGNAPADLVDGSYYSSGSMLNKMSSTPRLLLTIVVMRVVTVLKYKTSDRRLMLSNLLDHASHDVREKTASQN